MSILQELLNLGLVDIGNDDSRFEKMLSTSTDLVQQFEQDPTLIVPSVLVALDGDVDENDPILCLVENLIILQWKTLRNTHTNRPRTLLRAIILDALNQLSKKSTTAAGILLYTAASPLLHKQMHVGKESRVLQDVLDWAHRSVEEISIGRLSSNKPFTNSSSPMEVTKSPKTTRSGISDKEILDAVASAAGPAYNGEQNDDPNPHWSNVGSPWSEQFTPRMTNALVKAVNLGVDRHAKAVESHINYLAEQLSLCLKQLETAQRQSAISSALGVQMQVLWWSQAKYSPSLRVSYRGLPRFLAAFAMALDLSNIVPALVPESVSHILSETFNSLTSEDTPREKKTVKEILSQLADYPADQLETFPKTALEGQGQRLSLYQLVIQANRNTVTEDKILQMTGLKPSLILTGAEFSQWVFRDVQAQKLVGELQ